MPERDPFQILLVEDNPADVDLVREALAETGLPYTFRTVPDGACALLFLRGAAPYAGESTPDLVLLDLNLPRVNGFQVLAQMKGDPALRYIPVVILSSSAVPADMLQGYDMHANCYMVKPTDLAEFFAAVKQLHKFWLGTAVLPLRAPK